jgi:hypothetical protein
MAFKGQRRGWFMAILLTSFCDGQSCVEDIYIAQEHGGGVAQLPWDFICVPIIRNGSCVGRFRIHLPLMD